MRINRPADIRQNQTHEGGPAHSNLTPMQQLRRSVLSCMLFEREFYEDGADIADRITSLAMQVPPDALAALAVEARSHFHLRHAPLLLLHALTKTGAGRKDGIVSWAIWNTILRADELTEFVALHFKDGRRPLSAQTKKGLAKAFTRFDAYQLAKYNRNYAVKLRDVMRLVRPKPRDDLEQAIYKQLREGTLAAPDTWEVALSRGADKCETFTRLLTEKKLGYLALLRNLRNMIQAGVDPALIEAALADVGRAHNVLPFRFAAAARAAPSLEPAIDRALLAKVAAAPVMAGITLVLVDISGSMGARLSVKSDLTRMDAAATLASVISAEHLRVFSFSGDVVEVPPRRGMAGVDAIIRSQGHGSTYLGRAVHQLNMIPHDRLIVITDEQTADTVPDPVAKHAYMINVASAKNGVGYGRWTHIDGFSEAVINYIIESEGNATQ